MQTHRQTPRYTDRHTETQLHRQTPRYTDKHQDTQTNTKINRQSKENCYRGVHLSHSPKQKCQFRSKLRRAGKKLDLYILSKITGLCPSCNYLCLQFLSLTRTSSPVSCFLIESSWTSPILGQYTTFSAPYPWGRSPTNTGLLSTSYLNRLEISIINYQFKVSAGEH